MSAAEGRERDTKRLAEQAESREDREVRYDVRRVKSLTVHADAQHLDDLRRDLLEREPRGVVPHELLAEVVERLLAEMGLLGGQLKGVLPLEVELQLVERLVVRQVEHLLQDQHG